jgi:hypothetical protein
MINTNYIYENKCSLSSDFCSNLIEIFEDGSNKYKYEGLTLGGLNKEIKDTTDMSIPENDEKWYKYHSFLTKELQRNLKKYLNILNNSKEINNEGQLTNVNYSYFDKRILKSDFFLMQKYKQSTGKYIYHNDFMVNKKDNKYRVVTFLWYINTVEEGGETSFGESFKIKPEQGKLILFPACWTFPHCGKIPLSSDKYIVTGWLYIDF